MTNIFRKLFKKRRRTITMQAVIGNPPFKIQEARHSYMVCAQWYDTHNVTNHVYVTTTPGAAVNAFRKDHDDETSACGITNVIKLD